MPARGQRREDLGVQLGRQVDEHRRARALAGLAHQAAVLASGGEQPARCAEGCAALTSRPGRHRLP